MVITTEKLLGYIVTREQQQFATEQREGNDDTGIN